MISNVDFRQFFYSKSGIILTSIIWGFGLAAMFRRVCKDRSCIVIRAPNPDWMKKQVLEKDDECYKMIPKTEECSS